MNPFPCLPSRIADRFAAINLGARLAGSAVLACALLLFCAPTEAAKIVDRIVAVVDGQIITQYDLDKELAPYFRQMGGNVLGEQNEQQLNAMRKKLLDRLVDDILLLKEAERLGFQVTDTEVENHIRQFKQSNNMTDEDLSRQLLAENMTREEYRRSIRENMMRHRLLSYMVRRKVLVTDEEIERYYREHIEEYATPREVELGLILLPPGKDAEALTQLLRQGDVSFEDAAREHSEGPGARNGGSLGKLKWSEVAPEWRVALENVQPGEVSRPFLVGRQQAILKLLEVIPGQERPMDQVREEIRQKLHEPKFARIYTEYMQGLRDKAIVDMRLQ